MLQQFKSINDLTGYLGTLLAELRKYGRHSTKELKSPVLRLMQVEEYLKKHIGKISEPVKQLPGSKHPMS